MTPVAGIPLPGCRHDVLGHALKAVGVLRALTECGGPDACDPSAEGWWNTDSATFHIRSTRYPDSDSLAKFFAEKYRPTPIIAAWNKSGGVTDKIEVTITGSTEALRSFAETNADALKELGLTATTAANQLDKSKPLAWSPDSSALQAIRSLASGTSLVVCVNASVTAPGSSLRTFVAEQAETLQSFGLPKNLRISRSGKLEFSIPCDNVEGLQRLLGSAGLPRAITRKESAKKDGTLPGVERLLASDPDFSRALELARQFVDRLQREEGADENVTATFLRYRDQLPDIIAESFDALCTLHLARDNDNPLFGRRGRPGDKVNADIFLNFWDYFIAFRSSSEALARASLFNERVVGSASGWGVQKGKGTPFFPDAIKSYNQGADWVTEDYPFCPLDYLLAVEGGLAMRGATSKTLNARSRTRAAFPFVFEATETMTDEQGKALKLASSFWFPVWTRPTSYHELQSFILDAQARLPSKECRFSSDFARAVRSQGVDAGFFAFQEFRFKLKGANVPWTVTGRFVPCAGDAVANILNELLAPVDESGFLNQFEFHTSREKKADLHPLRARVYDAIESAAAEPDGSKILDVLCRLADLNAQLAKSRSLRKKIDEKERVIFVPPLHCEDWSEALAEFEADREFEIARAVASIRGRERQPDGTYSQAEPLLGSLVPLRRGQRTWFPPDSPSPQAVWSGVDLPRDLSAVLARRVIDSEPDVRPALVGVCSARLASILAFLRGELDDRRIAGLIEGLCLIDWEQSSASHRTDSPEDADEEPAEPVPVAYAAVRSLVEIACDARPRDVTAKAAPTPRASVQRTISLVTRREPGVVAAGVSEALRRLAIVGVPNTYGEDSRRQTPTLAGRDVITLGTGLSELRCDPVLAQRLAAAAFIPLDRRDCWKLFRTVTLPQTT
jgi:CRISPR-associated protein Csx17